MNDGDCVQAGPDNVVWFPGNYEGADIQWTQPGPDMLQEILTDLRKMD